MFIIYKNGMDDDKCINYLPFDLKHSDRLYLCDYTIQHTLTFSLAHSYSFLNCIETKIVFRLAKTATVLLYRVRFIYVFRYALWRPLAESLFRWYTSVIDDINKNGNTIKCTTPLFSNEQNDLALANTYKPKGL